MRTHNLAILIFHQISTVTMQHTRTAFTQRRSVIVAVQPQTAGFNTVHSHFGMFDVRVEQTDRIGTTANAGNQRIRLAAELLNTLTLYFAADHTLEITHQHRVRVRPRRGTDDVESIIDVGYPVAHGFVHGVFQGFGAGFNRFHFGA